jgi:hypothetical protein
LDELATDETVAFVSFLGLSAKLSIHKTLARYTKPFLLYHPDNHPGINTYKSTVTGVSKVNVGINL